MSAETPFPAQAEVIVRHFSGSDNTQIAKEMGMARNTVAKILNEAQVSELVEQSKSILMGALPDSARTIARVVKKSPFHAWELLDRTGVMPKRAEEMQQINIGVLTEGLPSLHAEAKEPSGE